MSGLDWGWCSWKNGEPLRLATAKKTKSSWKIALSIPRLRACHYSSPTIKKCQNCPKWKPLRGAFMNACAETALFMCGLLRIPGCSRRPAARQAKGLVGRVFVAVHRTGKHIVCELAAVPQERIARRRGATTGCAVDCASGHDGAIACDHSRRAGRRRIRMRDWSLRAARNCASSIRGDSANSTFAILPAEKAFNAAGAEPLEVEQEEFAAIFRGRRLAIKAALLNQSLLSGVGNIYADESLFHAGIRPRRSAGRLTKVELERLRVALKSVLEHAIRLGGSSVSDYVDAEGMRGFFQLEHCVYLRTGLPCRTCKTPIRQNYSGWPRNPFLPKLPAIKPPAMVF